MSKTKRITSLTEAQKSRFDEWTDHWIEIGLRTGDADRPRFESAVRECYRFAGLKAPKVIVWTTSPLAVSLAGPIASLLVEMSKGQKTEGAVRSAVNDAVRDAVGGAVTGAVHGAVNGAVRGAVNGAVNGAVHGAVGGAVGGAVRKVVEKMWFKIIGGQLWAGGWYWGGAWVSFFREVCELELEGDLWDRAKAYEETIKSSCWWFAHRDFVIVSEHPVSISRELTNPNVSRGWGSHRLHSENSAACLFRDGWGVWSWHGVRVPQQVIENPKSLTVDQILNERNVEVRRIMMERFGHENFITESGAKAVHSDETGDLYQIQIPDDEPLVMVRVMNSTPEADGSFKAYWLRVNPELRPLLNRPLPSVAAPADVTENRLGPPQKMLARNAVASTFGMTGDEYVEALIAQT